MVQFQAAFNDNWIKTTATESIDLAAAFVVPDELLVDALVAALEQGVRLRILLPGPHIDSETVKGAGFRTARRALQVPALIPADVLADLMADLERQLARLERSMIASAEAARTVELDQQAVGRLSRMDSLQNQQMSPNLQDREQARYGAIRAALARMEDGSYGRCTDCDADIAMGRLVVMPEGEHCATCGG